MADVVWACHTMIHVCIAYCCFFGQGCVCHPYLSLQFHSILNDVNVRSFVLGATNILFRQQKQVTDVIVEVEKRRRRKLYSDCLFADVSLSLSFDECWPWHGWTADCHEAKALSATTWKDEGQGCWPWQGWPVFRSTKCCYVNDMAADCDEADLCSETLHATTWMTGLLTMTRLTCVHKH